MDPQATRPQWPPNAGNGVHADLDEVCLAAFDRALADVGLTGDTAAAIAAYFRRATQAQRAYAESDGRVPEGLPFNYAEVQAGAVVDLGAV